MHSVIRPRLIPVASGVLRRAQHQSRFSLALRKGLVGKAFHTRRRFLFVCEGAVLAVVGAATVGCRVNCRAVGMAVGSHDVGTRGVEPEVELGRSGCRLHCLHAVLRGLSCELVPCKRKRRLRHTVRHKSRIPDTICASGPYGDALCLAHATRHITSPSARSALLLVGAGGAAMSWKSKGMISAPCGHTRLPALVSPMSVAMPMSADRPESDIRRLPNGLCGAEEKGGIGT